MKFVQQGEQVIVAMGDQYQYREYRIPGILPTRDGAVLLALEARNNPAEGDRGDIDVFIFRREADGTLNRVLAFGQSHLPKDGDPDRSWHNPVLVPDGDDIHLLYTHQCRETFIRTSHDQGRTWGEPIDLTADFTMNDNDECGVMILGPGHGIQLKSGRLLIACYLHSPKMAARFLAGAMISDDHGKTWRLGAHADVLSFANETSAVQTPDGKVYLNFRTENRVRVLGVSSDDGETLDLFWMPGDLCDPRCFAALAEWKGTLLHSNCDSYWKRTATTVKQSVDGGKSWNVVWQVDETGAYSDMAVVDDTLFVFFERLIPCKQGGVRELVLKWAKEA